MTETAALRKQSGIGIACTVAGAGLLTTSDSFVKWLTDGYPVTQIIVIRGAFILLPMVLLAWRLGKLDTLRVRRPGWQLLRALLFTASVFLFLNGLRFNPLAINTAIAFASPLIITALAVPLLGETIGWRRWAAVLVGFGGVLAIVRPFGEAINLYALLPLACAVTGAFQDIITRRISDTESALSVLLCSTIVTMIAAACFMFDGTWRMPDAVDFGLLVMTGLLSGAAHYLLIETFVRAEAAVVVPFRYTALVWGLAIGFVVWGDIPSGLDWLGILLIVGSGIYIVHREALRRRASA
ncbi:MAG: DMT family transporter [Rhodospirillaceae bacterium]|nr:DMT family transporter [Rhodospirillaceae bacterium]MDD9913950.1 DMT family transporter [Rhodospirillaceae bacterium]